jgi:hypothetical protein
LRGKWSKPVAGVDALPSVNVCVSTERDVISELALGVSETTHICQAENSRTEALTTLCTHRKSRYKIDLLWELLRALNRPGRCRTVWGRLSTDHLPLVATGHSDRGRGERIDRIPPDAGPRVGRARAGGVQPHAAIDPDARPFLCDVPGDITLGIVKLRHAVPFVVGVATEALQQNKSKALEFLSPAISKLAAVHDYDRGAINSKVKMYENE